MASGDRFVSLAAGNGYHTCGLTAEGMAYCWGTDSNGVLGNGAATTIDQLSPSPVDTASLPAGDRFVSLAIGTAHTCGLTAQGLAYCWGVDAHGRLGNGAALTASQESPSAVDTTPLAAGDRFVSLVAGNAHTCGLTAQGQTYCWGRDNSYQLGNGAVLIADQASPSLVDISGLASGDRFVSLEAGNDHTCGVTAQGQAYCWGSDFSGQLGNGSVLTTNQASPSLLETSGLSSGDRLISLTAGNFFACGSTAQGYAYCWGTDALGQLGNGAVVGNQEAPSPIDVSGF